MLSPDVRVEGFSHEEWLRIGHVFTAVRPPEAPRARGGVVALTTSGKLRKLVSTRRGRLEHVIEVWPCELSELAKRHEASWALEVTTGSLDLLADRFAERLRPADTYLSQTIEMLLVMRELEAEGHVRVWPWPVAEWPIPTERAVLRALDSFCPVGRVALLGVFARGELYSAVALKRGARGIEAIVGPGELRPHMGLLSGDWQRDYRFLADATEKVLGPLALGCFGELYTFQSLVGAPPGSWSMAVAGREIMLSPVAPALAVPLGLDAGRAMWASLRGFAERVGAADWLAAAGRLRPTREFGLPAFEADIKAWLGFDPLRLLSRLVSASRE